MLGVNAVVIILVLAHSINWQWPDA
jgi:hypothetical protein